MAIFRKDTYNYLQDNKTLFEVVMIADQYGNMIGPSNPSGMAVDAFGRARTSQPLTLFDDFNRYTMSEQFATSNTSTATYTYNSNTAHVALTVDTTSGAKVIRETKKVFAYQPGKSLQILTTFVFNEPKDNLTQSVGYYDDQNGVFLKQAGNTISFGIRSNITSTPTDTTVAQGSWNVDNLDGDGPSHLTLDLTKAHIFFTDIEWLGVGSVRCGFVINGQFIHCHTFHHANEETGPYMSTACLPVRYEIENTAETASSSTLKQICSAVISEGGYQLRGRQFSAGSSVTSVKDMPTAGTFVPIVSIRLKSANLDGIVLPKDVSLLGVGNNTRLEYRIVAGGALDANASWTSAGSNSSVEYDISATGITGGRVLKKGFVGINNQSGQTITLADGDFIFQLERDGLANTATVFSLIATGAANGDDALGSIDWEEIT